LIITRLPDLKSENELDSLVSKESSFLFNNLILLAACFAVLWGTIFPVISEAVQGEQISVSAPFFNRVNIPIGLVLLFLTGVGPLLAWRRSSLEELRRNFLISAVAGLAAGIILFALGVRHLYALTCFALSIFVTGTIIQEFHKGARTRKTHRGGSYLSALVDLTLTNTRRYGGYLVHFGIVLIFIGVAGSAFNEDVTVSLEPGETMNIGNYEAKLVRLDEGANPNYQWSSAVLEVSRDNKVLGIYAPERHFYMASEQPTSEVRRYSNFREDLYMVFAGMTEEGNATVQIYLNPLVRWVWIGGIIMFFASILTMVPNKRELKVLRKEGPPVATVTEAKEDANVA
jgi:cytochrome c-type biogenesis protein CcmF